MGIVFHQSCYQVPDSRTRKLKKQRENQKKKNPNGQNLKPKLRARRRLQFDDMVQEARIWMYAISLPHDFIAKGDTHIRLALDSLNDEIVTALLGDKIANDKILRVSGRIARNILVPGIDNIDEEKEYYPNEPEEIRKSMDDKYMRASTFRDLCDNCPNFASDNPNIRTWKEIRNVAANYSYEGQPLNDLLTTWQLEYGKIDLGLPKGIFWTDRMKTRMLAQLESKKAPDEVRDILTWKDSDLIVAIPHMVRHSRAATAALVFPKNVLKLYPPFFKEKGNFQSLRDIPIGDGAEFVDVFRCWLRFFLHEITHAAGVLETRDQVFQYLPNRLDYMDKFILIPAPSQGPGRRGENQFWAYGLEAALALARRDRTWNRNRAEDNADSWSFYFMLKMIMLVYPDLDIMEAVRTRDLFAPRTRHVRKRSRLLHHCTLFQVLRHKDAGDLRDHFDYDPRKDVMAGPDAEPHQTFAEVIEVLKSWDEHFYDK